MLDKIIPQSAGRWTEATGGHLRALFDRYSIPMYNTALRMLNNTCDAEEVVRTAFSETFCSMHKLKNQAYFGDRLKQLVAAKAISKIKGRRKKWVDVDKGHIDDFVIYEMPVLDESDLVYDVENIKREMRRLPDGYRTVLVLHLLENYSYREIAALLGIAEATVQTQYIRAKKKLLDGMRENKEA